MDLRYGTIPPLVNLFPVMKLPLLPALGCAGLLTLFSAVSLSAQEARKQDPKELDAAFSRKATQPAQREGAGIPLTRGVRKSVGPSDGGGLVEQSRSYSRGARIITSKDGQTAEAPYVEVPLLFHKGRAELLPDAATRSNLELLARKVQEYGKLGGRFVIEGHASMEGDGAFNQRLSEERAREIYVRLIGLEVPAQYLLRAEGRGSRDAQAPATASEAQLEQDRKVLVVKEQ